MMANIIGRYKYQVRKFNYFYILQKGKGCTQPFPIFAFIKKIPPIIFAIICIQRV